MRADLRGSRGEPRARSGVFFRGERAREPAAVEHAEGPAGRGAGGERAGDRGAAGSAGRSVQSEHADGAAAVLFRVPRRRATHFRQQRTRSRVSGKTERGWSA